MVGGYAVCPVGDSDKIVICVISICDSSVIGVDNLGKIAHCVILIANGLAVAFRRSIARDSAHGVIEDLTNLTACVDDLLANVQLVVLVRLCTARNGGLGCESAHIVVGVIGSTAERTGKTGYVAKQIVGRRAYVVCCIANLGTASSIDSRNSF